MRETDKSTIFINIIEAHKGIIYKITNSYCKDDEDRNDLVQEIVLRLWKAFENYNDEFKHSTWIYRIALNTAISNYRKEKVKEKHIVKHAAPIFEVSDTSNTAEKEQNYLLLLQFVSELKELDRALILLYFEEKSYKEISEILGISETNVGTRMGRIKIFLKEKFTTVK